MISLSVTPGDGETSYYDKTGNELQSDVTIDGKFIRGTLNYLDNYTTFLGDTAKHHLVLKLSSEDADKIETKMTGGQPSVMKDYVQVSDGFCVYSVTDEDGQKIHVKVTKGGKSAETIYDLTGLTLAPKGDD